MKLRVVELLIITTLPAMVLAEKGLPSFGLVAATLIGGTLAAGASNAFNMVLEAETDKLMARTSQRPLVTGSVTRTQAIIFASILTVLSLLIFEIFTTELATLLAALAIFYYVVIYTIILKPNTSQNIVWGGAAGCMPVLIGWAAVTGSLTLVPVAFFLVVFFWTPPHFWALAIKYKDDYSAAGIPMLPSVSTQSNVINQMWFHTIAMVVSSAAMIQLAGLPVWVLCATVFLGAVFTFQLFALKENSDNYNKVAAGIFHWSITYLSLFSVLLVVAQLLSA
ncbi:protoheme IX farnesyltransferase [Candidatus Planktophila versatilis]|uniref:Protoheme IX farnesyltransferase n=2 Tax=Candidatus Planktophila versatilis TaxID=1884905 RepID=A0AAD0E7B2_9ACTN|nr:protoheme IX farnesyltransferase [Candidatus Planktophila versatilis]